jgi:hypothetical protein
MSEQPALNDRVDYERIGRFIYSFHRICGSVDELTKIGVDTSAPQELAARALRVVEKFEYVLKNSAFIAEAQLESTLRKAADLQAEIKEWRSQGHSGR